METLLSYFRKSFSNLWGGATARLSTLMSSETDSSSEKLSKSMATKMAELLLEREQLREQIRLLQESLNKHYDV